MRGALGANDTVGFVQTDALGTGAGSVTQGTAVFPLSAMPPGPLARPYPIGTPGLPAPGSNVTVPASQITTLDAGSYGALLVDGTVYLSPGFFSFTSVTVGQNAALYTTSRSCGIAELCQTTVQISNSLIVGAQGTLSTYVPSPCGIDEHCVTPAFELSITVSGNNTSTTPAATLARNSTVDALLSVPEGTLFVGDGVEASGAFAAFDVIVGDNVEMLYDSGLPAASPQGIQQLSGYYGFLPTTSPLLAPVVGPCSSEKHHQPRYWATDTTA